MRQGYIMQTGRDPFIYTFKKVTPLFRRVEVCVRACVRTCVSVCIKSSLHSVRFLQLLHCALKCTSKGGTCKLN